MCFPVRALPVPSAGSPRSFEDGVSGNPGALGDADTLARAVEGLIQDPSRRVGEWAAQRSRRARERFSAEAIVPRYEALYRRVCG